jgi:hypothetical protein
MTRTLRSRSGYALAGGVLSAALALAGGAAGAESAHATSPHTPTPHATAPHATSPHTRTAKATNPLKVSSTTAKVRETLDYTGTPTGIKAGAKAELQQLLNKRWSDVPGKTATVTRSGTYTITDDFRSAGRKTMRTVVAGVPSNTLKITVK